ncbi:hypothetical protein AMATHDRAFT_186548 [Amanita thiersii Skay4041]|uniref:U4/U6 snRNA-associated-splicing factor PRP24 n=1 Tax=Amanita thiersii Skay4041 TaxID=703135 RepID=A0A2A9P0K2_9AGAR|nr:hypothetical protein AMATHDRAFT_186548 [Amanita thiersii Skay4041]
MESEVHNAMAMLPEFLAAGEDVWLYLISAKEAQVDLNTPNGVEELLALYERAEADYLSIPVLQRHLEFLITNHAKYFSEEIMKPPELGDLFATEWTRVAIGEVVNKGIGHLNQSHFLWDKQRDWELEMLHSAPEGIREELVVHIQQLHLDRLQQPHSNSEETFQSYSTFTTNFKPPEAYEMLLVAASKIRGQGQRAFERREKLEAALTQSANSLDVYGHYIAVERRAKYPDLFVISATYERAIAEAAKKRFNGDTGAEEALRLFWAGYCDALRILDANWELQLSTLKRATRSVPGSGEVWARHIRFLERLENSEIEIEEVGTVEDIYNQAFNTKLVQLDVDQITALVLARAGYEKRRIEESGDQQANNLAMLIGVLENGVELVYKASKIGDGKLRLEKYLADIYERMAGLPESATKLWQSAVKVNKSSYQVWTLYIETLMRHEMYEDVRALFEDIHKKNLDWPEVIWELWISFEHLHGDVNQIDVCLDKIEKAQMHTNSRRAKEAEKAAYQAMQIAMEAQATSIPATTESAVAPSTETQTVTSEPIDRGTKRPAEDDISQDTQKKAKTDSETKTVRLKRDRENSTIFVSDLPKGITEDELETLFNGCGNIREIKITSVSNILVATIEFYERDSVPAALTKDKKRLHGEEISVHLAWKSTLYVTNFPESSDDAYIRDLFGKYGTIFDVRWPSKKIKNTRRFCYVQYISPESAEAALELHGRELESNRILNAFISDPERKKTRTDADADEKELYVAGLSKFTTQADLEKLFKIYGTLKAVRLATGPDGHAKGYAFVEFEQGQDARAALAANNYEMKKRRIAVTMANSNVRLRQRHTLGNTGLGRTAEIRSRSLRIRNLPTGTQEGLLQQALEKVTTSIKRVEVIMDRQEAIIELSSVAEAGKLLLRVEPIVFGGNTLELSEEAEGVAPPITGGLFIPRRAGISRPKAGLGYTRNTTTSTAGGNKVPTFVQHENSQGRGQDDFRKMLSGN